MKPRDEDSLIQLAFGELTEAEASQVREALKHDRVGASKFAQYERLKDGLALLREIPEPQISTARIREAILGQGLRQRPDGLRWAWVLLGPAVAAVAAISLYPFRGEMPRLAGVVAPARKDSTMVAFVKPEKVTFAPPLEITSPGNAALTVVDFGTVSTTGESRHASRRHKRKATNDEDFVANLDRALAYQDVSQTTPVPASLAGIAAPTARDAVLRSVSPAPKTPTGSAKNTDKILVVKDAPDNVTGAQQATEVESNSNVVIGG